MTNPSTDTTISAILARPSAQMTGHEVLAIKTALLNTVGVLGEAQLYNDVSNVMKADPHSAHDMLLRQGEETPESDFAFPQIRVQLLAACVTRMREIESTWDPMAEMAAGGPLDKAREVAFREEPGRWLPGATASDVVLLHAPGFGVVRYRGREHVWTYAALTHGDAKAGDITGFLDFRPEFGGIIVGPAALEANIDLPMDCIFVAVDAGLDAPVTDGGVA